MIQKTTYAPSAGYRILFTCQLSSCPCSADSGQASWSDSAVEKFPLVPLLLFLAMATMATERFTLMAKSSTRPRKHMNATV